MSIKITCPECNHEFNAESAMAHDLEHQIKSDLQKEYSNKLIGLKNREDEISNQKEAIEKLKQDQDKIVKEEISKQKKRLKTEIEAEVKKESESGVKDLLEKISKQSDQMSELRKTNLTFQQQVMDLKKREEDLALEIQQKVLDKTNKIKEETQKEEQEKHMLDLRQRDELVNTLKDKIEDMKRKADQGSMQSQGEILELEVERILSTLYPLDRIEEIKKGTNGADCLQHVVGQNGQVAGIVAFETKRTKSFSDKWIEKLKGDMRNHKADIGVIVTETMPEGMKTFGINDGVWICSFKEVEGLSRVLRQTIIKVAHVQIANEGKGEKMEVLYKFLTSEEFKQQMEAIVRGFTNMKGALESEKRSMKRIWKQREKELEMIIDGASEMYGSIRGIAGNSISQIKELELDGQLDTLDALDFE
jgi:hypothetical protein